MVLFQRDIDDICKHDPILKHAFGGVKARNEYINKSAIKIPIFFIKNNDFRGESGRHWSLIVYFKRITVYLGTFGFQPYTLGYRELIEREGKPLLTSTRPIQDPLSSTCGWHVLFMALQLLQNKSLNDILDNFYSNNLTLNDYKVVNFWKKRLWLTRNLQIM